MAKIDVTYRIEVEQDLSQVRGNALASGDEEEDRKCEDEIIRRLDNGDVWAWAYVTVVAEYKGFKGKAGLGQCCYANEEDFKTGGYFEDLCDEAFQDLMETLHNIRETGLVAEEVICELAK